MSIKNVELGIDVKIPQPTLVNLYGCKISDRTKIGAFVEIQNDVIVGYDCKIQSFVFIPSGVFVGNGVFIGPHVCFINDKNPSAVDSQGKQLILGEWTLSSTIVQDRVSIGANSTILCGITIGEGARIGAGSVVTKDIPPGEMWYGNPARKVR